VHLTHAIDTKSCPAAGYALVVCAWCTCPVSGWAARDVVRRDMHPVQGEPRPPDLCRPGGCPGTPVTAAPTGCAAATRLTG
jgi:hypothetical protein